MGFFDPAYRKILAKSPQRFQQSAPIWGPLIEVAIIEENAAAAGDVFRAYVIGRLALHAARGVPGMWSSDSLNYIEMATVNAERSLPQQLILRALVTLTAIDRMPEFQTDTPDAPSD